MTLKQKLAEKERLAAEAVGIRLSIYLSLYLFFHLPPSSPVQGVISTLNQSLR